MLLVVFFVFKTPVPIVEVSKEAKRCPMHKWEYDAEEKLICDWCKLRPGQIATKNGEY